MCLTVQYSHLRFLLIYLAKGNCVGTDKIGSMFHDVEKVLMENEKDVLLCTPNSAFLVSSMMSRNTVCGNKTKETILVKLLLSTIACVRVTTQDTMQ